MSLLRQFLISDRWLTIRRSGLIAIWFTLVILTHIPVPRSVKGLQVSDKLVHFMVYFPVGLLLPTCRVRCCLDWWKCLLVIAICAALDELLQIPVHRHASVLDWLADVMGALLGSFTLLWITGRSPLSTRETPPSVED